jgi:hypothetical protein
MDRGAGQISNAADSAMVRWRHTSQANRFELPGWLCPRSALRGTRLKTEERLSTHRCSGPLELSKRIPFSLREEEHWHPPSKRKKVILYCQEQE